MKINLPSYMTVVDDKLIRGRAITSPIKLYKLKQAGVNQIIDLRNTSYVEKPLERIFCKLLGIKYKNCKYPHRLDTLPTPNFFLDVLKTIKNNTGKSYIHCQNGKRRTGICVALYEKYFTQKPIDKIISNMINLGFRDVFEKPKAERSKKYFNIIKQFLKTYCFKNN